MSHLLHVISVLVVIVNVLSQKPADPKATKETVCLFENLYNISQSDSIIFGHYEDFLYGQHFF